MKSEEIYKDPVIKTLFKEGGIEQPSHRFTNNIIDTIKDQFKESAFVYKPVISRNAWIAIAFFGVSLFAYLMFSSASDVQGLNLYGYSVNIDTSFISDLFNKIAFSFKLTPILKTSFLALIFFTFSNLIIFELRSRSFFK
jgi:hypothetical protein